MLSKYELGLSLSPKVEKRIDEINAKVGSGEFLSMGKYLCLGFTDTATDDPKIVLVSETGRTFELPYTGKDVDFFQV